MTAPRVPRLYLDSSALVARYYSEPHTATVGAAVASAATLASSFAAYPEARAGLARLAREKRLANRPHSGAVAQLEADWPVLERLELSAAVAAVAGALAAGHALKGYDAVHLASALVFARRPGGAVFLSYDARLNKAAEAEGLTLWTA